MLFSLSVDKMIPLKVIRFLVVAVLFVVHFETCAAKTVPLTPDSDKLENNEPREYDVSWDPALDKEIPDDIDPKELYIKLQSQDYKKNLQVNKEVYENNKFKKLVKIDSSSKIRVTRQSYPGYSPLYPQLPSAPPYSTNNNGYQRPYQPQTPQYLNQNPGSSNKWINQNNSTGSHGGYPHANQAHQNPYGQQYNNSHPVTPFNTNIQRPSSYPTYNNSQNNYPTKGFNPSQRPPYSQGPPYNNYPSNYPSYNSTSSNYNPSRAPYNSSNNYYPSERPPNQQPFVPGQAPPYNSNQQLFPGQRPPNNSYQPFIPGQSPSYNQTQSFVPGQSPPYNQNQQFIPGQTPPYSQPFVPGQSPPYNSFNNLTNPVSPYNSQVYPSKSPYNPSNPYGQYNNSQSNYQPYNPSQPSAIDPYNNSRSNSPYAGPNPNGPYGAGYPNQPSYNGQQSPYGNSNPNPYSTTIGPYAPYGPSAPSYNDDPTKNSHNSPYARY